MSVIHLDWADQFKKEVIAFDGIVLIDFWAERCSPCKMLGPIIEEVALHYDKQTEVKVIKIDVDANQDLAAAFQVQSIPTVYVMHKGQAVDRMIGVQAKDVYIAKIDGLLEAWSEKHEAWSIRES